MSDDDYVEERTPDIEASYDMAVEDWLRGDDDLDGVCIIATLTEEAAKGLAALHDYPWFEEAQAPESEWYAEYQECLEEGGRAVSALIMAGFIRRDDFSYDDETHKVVRA